MSYADGWAALKLEMPPRVPRVEFDAENHWALVSAVTGLAVDAHSPTDRQQQARVAFVRAWDYDIRLTPLIGHGELDAKRTTMGHPLVMGRRTWESLGRPLPGRTNIVVTRNRGYVAPGAVVVHSLEEALHAAGEATDRLHLLGLM